MTPQQLKDLKDLFNKQYGRLLILAIIGVAITIGLLIGHRLQQDRHTGNQVTAWHRRYGYVITKLANDFALAQKDSKASNSKELAADCTQIENDSTAAEHLQKIPDPGIQRFWVAALEDDAAGGKVCVEAVNEQNITLMREASSNFGKGTSNLQTVNKDFQKARQEK